MIQGEYSTQCWEDSEHLLYVIIFTIIALVIVELALTAPVRVEPATITKILLEKSKYNLVTYQL